MAQDAEKEKNDPSKAEADKPAAKKAEAPSKPPAPAPAAAEEDDDEDEEEDGDGDEDGNEDEDEESGTGAEKDADDDDDDDDEPEDEDEPEPEAPPAVTKKAAPVEEDDDDLPPPQAHEIRPVTPPAPAASLGKSVTAFMVILVGLAAGFWLLGNAESPFGKSGAPKWKIGQSYPITLTLDPSDDNKLSCAADADIGGKHCEYKTKTEKYPEKLDDTTMLRPYRTTGEQDNVGLLAAGVWSHPDLAPGKRPSGRFSYKCSFKVEGKVTRPAVRWDVAGQWGDQDIDWFAGAVTNCQVQK